MQKTRQELGKWGENKAYEYLRRNNYKIIERNWRASNFGEIDIIASKDNEYVFVEVKTKQNKHFGLPEEELTDDKKKKLDFAIYYYLDTNGLYSKRWRFDFIAIEIINTKAQLRHYRYAS